MCSSERLTYQTAGVNIDKGNQAVELFKPLVARTMRPGVMGSLGGFGGLFALDTKKYKNPVLVSGTDGVGTKLAVAHKGDKHNTIGIDCVAMCVNDILVLGAEPLFFLDYLAVGELEPRQVADIVAGIAEGCYQAGCALIGGETAEMPGFYRPGEYDVAGFCVGVADKDKIIDGKSIVPGDILIGLPSSGLHSNGYSLARKVLFEICGFQLDQHMPELGCTLKEEMLKPTKIYVQLIQSLLGKFNIKGMVHITGGGLIENPPRVLPASAHIEIDYGSWHVPPIFNLLEEKGGIDKMEMLRTFNNGIGYILVLDPTDAIELQKELEKLGEKSYQIGRVTKGSPGVTIRGIS